MIYNLFEYLDTQLPGIECSCEGFREIEDDTCIELSGGMGNELPWLIRQEHIVSFLSRSTEATIARANALSVYNLIKKKYGLVLPAVTVNGTDYPAVKTWAIRPVNMPQASGRDEKGRALYAFSFEIVTTNKITQ